MIPKAHITAWRVQAPLLADAQVEQDLIISRAIVELFRVPEIASSLVFRGGTALYKLYLDPPARYSEDIDLVQARPEPIGSGSTTPGSPAPWTSRPTCSTSCYAPSSARSTSGRRDATFCPCPNQLES
jgi:hypothetical protein